MEGDARQVRQLLHHFHFNPLPPHGGRPIFTPAMGFFVRNFNPLPPHGGRLQLILNCEIVIQFQSTPSAWRETILGKLLYNISIFQSTPSAWRETLLLCITVGAPANFNPLPPHGGRRLFDCMEVQMIYFNPLPPHGGRLR